MKPLASPRQMKDAVREAEAGESLFLLKDFFGHPARKNRQKCHDR
jgi:hypothetical protein